MNYIDIFLEALSAEKGRSEKTLASYASDLNMAEVFKTDWNEVDSKLTRITNLSKGFIIDGIIHNYDQSYTSDGVLM